MNLIKKYGAIIGIILVVLVFIAVRSSGNKFRPDAMKQAAASLDNSNIVTSDQAAALEGNRLMIILDKPGKYSDAPGVVNIEPAYVVTKANMKMIRQNKGPVILSSADLSLSAGVWMVLSQMGVKNVYILSETKDDETLKHEFRPQTMSQPEF